MTFRLPLLATLAALGLAPLASGQTLIHAVYADGSIDRFGWAIANAGDVDADGVDDFLASATLDDTAGPNFGRVGIYSGATAELIRNHFGTTGDDQYGTSVSGAGDVNGDGFADVMVGMPWSSDNGGFRQGKVWVFSGADGALLHELFGDSDSDYFGSSLCSLGDVDGDGSDDFAIGAELDDPADVSGAGTAYVYSGATGTLLWDFHGTYGQENLGTTMANAGDVNGDGVDDLITGAPRNGVNGVYAGAAYVVDGATGSQLYVFRGQAGNYLGSSVAGAGDVNGDGTADLIAGATDFPQGPGYASVYSGANGLVLHTVQHPTLQFGLLFGSAVEGVGDLNGDGKDEFAVGRQGYGEGITFFDGDTGSERFDIGFPTLPLQGGLGGRIASMGDVNGDGVPDVLSAGPINNTFETNAGVTFVFSGAELPLDADVNTVSVLDGGTQTFEIDMGPAHAGEFYWMFGSITGVAPGTPIGAYTLGLNFDAYFQSTLLNPNVAPLGASLGTLDAEGRATATFSLPAGSDPAMVGRVGHHALVTIALAPLTFTAVSNSYLTVLAP